MIADTLEALKNYNVKGMDKAVDFILSCTKDIADGIHQIEGLDGYANVTSYDTKEFKDGMWECHRKYLDVQAVIDGEEVMYVAPLSTMKDDIPYNEEKDCAVPAGDPLLTQVLVPGYAAILWPQDVHMPKMNRTGKCAVKKVIVKIKID